MATTEKVTFLSRSQVSPSSDRFHFCSLVFQLVLQPILDKFQREVTFNWRCPFFSLLLKQRLVLFKCSIMAAFVIFKSLTIIVATMKAQTTLTKFLGLSSSSSSSSSNHYSDKDSDEGTSKPQYWTGVKHRSQLMVPRVALFDIV